MLHQLMQIPGSHAVLCEYRASLNYSNGQTKLVPRRDENEDYIKSMIIDFIYDYHESKCYRLPRHYGNKSWFSRHVHATPGQDESIDIWSKSINL